MINLNTLKMKNFLIPFLFIACFLMTACDSKDDPEINPIRFGRLDYTIRVGIGTNIGFVDGGGVYELTASNPDVLGKFYIDNETKTLRVIPSSTGESTLTITDVAADTSTTLRITVEDFYLSFTIKEIEGDNTNSYLDYNNEIRFIRDEGNTKPVKILWQNKVSYEIKCIAEGYFDIERSGTNIFTLNLKLRHDSDKEFKTFNYTLGGDGEYLKLFDKWFGYDWDDSIASKSLPVKQIKMTLTDPSNNCKITCTLQPF